MPFNQNDIYTSSGSVQLFNAWTPYVSKFDTSSFYNWEQDNLPLYDVEERTYELWEQQGFPTSSLTGFAFTVSADTPSITLDADRTIFTDVSSAIAAIPKVVRFPVLIEVANYGDLGPLELHNFRIEEGGSIEIINRGFARTYNASADCVQATGGVGPNRSHNLVSRVSSIDLSSTISDTSAVHISTPVFSATTDERATSTSYALYPKHTQRKSPLTVSIKDSSLLSLGQQDRFAGTPYESAVDTAVDDTTASFDVSATTQSTDTQITRAKLTSTGDDEISGNFYLNSLTKLSVKNCDGPVYIRNFFVDGETTEDYAISVVNSDVVLENCSAARARQSGFRFDNSKVILSRSAFSYRNYNLTTPTTREAEAGYGFHALNSEVTLSSVPQVVGSTTVGDTGASGGDATFVASRNYAGFVLENSKLLGGIRRVNPSVAIESSIVASELNSGYGMLLANSHVNLKGLVDFYGNDKGVQADNSHFVYEQMCFDAHSNEAIRCRNSSFLFDSITNPTEAGQADRKQLDFSGNGQHIDLQKNSSFGFRRKDNIPQAYGHTRFENAHGVIKWDGTNRSTLPAITVNDGSDLELLQSTVLVNNTADNIGGSPAYGRAIKVTNSSKASLFGTETGCSFLFGPASYSQQQKMAGIYASNNSQVNVHGPTALGQFGVDICVEDNSVLNVEPARYRDEFGLEVSAFDLSSGGNHTSVELHATRACLVANRNSSINCKDLGAYPANWSRTSTGQAYLDSGSDYPIDSLGTSAYTSSGCLQFYPNPQDSSAISDFNLDDLSTGFSFSVPNFPKFTARTGLNRFFLTPEIINSTDYTNLEHMTQGGVCVRAVNGSEVNVKNVHFPLGTNSSPLDGLHYNTSGSECDKLMIWNIADTSRLHASHLSVSGMHPANIQYHGPSAIYASSVDGVNSGSQYDAPASGAPELTPDTGALSVLDSFGAGSSVWFPPVGADINSEFDRFYFWEETLSTTEKRAMSEAGLIVSSTSTPYKIGSGPNSSDNQGVFRIYWSPKPAAKLLQNDLSGYFKGKFDGSYVFDGAVGPAYHIFAQGYNCSAPVSALVPDGQLNASSDFPELLKFSYDEDGDGLPERLWTSGFYYCSEFVEDNPTQCMLDESAAKTFANAQNAALGSSGRPKKVTLYRARNDAAGNRGAEAYQGDTSGTLGFKSANIFDLSRDN